MTQRHKKIKKSKKAITRSNPRRNRFRLPGFSEFHLEDRTVPTNFTLTNPNPITIPGGAQGSLYPSPITVSVPAGEQLTSLQVVFNNLSHDQPDDIDAMLIAPDGSHTHIYLMSDCGGGADQPISGVNLTFDDSGVPLTTGQIVTGTYQPTNIDQGDPDTIPGAPATAPVTTLAGFKGINPNGVWELRIVGDSAPNTGVLQGGWTITGTTRVNSAPVANNDSYTFNEDTTLTTTAGGTPHGVLFNDTDADSDPLTAQLVSGVSHGTLTFNANGDGGFTYVPRANYNGTDTFTYRATDNIAFSNVATVTLNITPVNDVPIANNDTFTVQNGGPQTLHRAELLNNDIDPDVTFRTTILSSGFEGLATNHFSPPVNGGAGADGTDWGEPPAGWVRDNTTTPPPDPTAGAPEFFGWHSMDIDSWISEQGDQDRSLFVRGNPGHHGTVMVADGDAYDDFPPGLGTTHMNTYLYTPTIPLDGINVDSVTLEVDSSFRPEAPDPGHSTGDIQVSFDNGVTWVELQHLSNANSGGTGGELHINDHLVLEAHNPGNATTVKFRFGYLDATNDWWWAIDNVNVTGAKTDPAQETIQIQSQPSQGSVSVDANGAVIYTPPTPGFTGTTSFTYRLFDGVATSNTATVNLTVNANNTAPVAAPDTFTTVQGNALATQFDRSILANDSDVDLNGGFIGMKTVLVAGPTPAQGTLALNPDGTFLFTPNPAFFGTATFTYKDNDGSRDSNTATVSIVVSQRNDFPPVANNDSYSLNNNATLTVPAASGVLANDTDADGNPLTAAATTGPNTLIIGPNHGTLTFNADGSFTYVPRAFFNGTDSFTYRDFDGGFFSNLATVTITVNAVNVAPQANNGTFYTQTNTPLTVPAPGVLRNAQDDGPNTQLFLENFDSLTLGPWNTGTTLTGDGTDWTDSLPTGWVRDNTTTTPPTSGTAAGAEFFGWHAMDADSWAAEQGNQARADFTRGGAGLHGTVLVADGDAYDDFFDIHTGAHMNTLLVTPSIPLGTITPNSLTLEFDSSFRPEDPAPLNQVGKVEVSYNNGTTWIPMTDFRTESIAGGAGSRVRTNEHVTLDALNPTGATTAKFRFSYLDAGNDWWWAIDNVKAGGRTANAGATQSAQIVTSPPASQGTLSLNSNGGFTFTPATGFTGVATFTYRMSDGVSNSAPATVSILVGPQAAVQVNDGSAQRSRVTSLQVTFAGIATFATTQPGQAFTLMRGTTAVTFDVTNIDYSSGATIVTLSNFGGAQFGSLSDGHYTLTVLSSQVMINGQALDGDGNGTPGGDLVYQFHRFYGDVNGDQHVDIADLGVFSQTFNLRAGQPGFLAYLDYNNDGAIDVADLGQFALRFFTVLP